MNVRIVKDGTKPKHKCDLPVTNWEKGIGRLIAFTSNPIDEIVQCEECLTYWISEHVGSGMYDNFNYWRKMYRFEVWRKVTKFKK